MGMAGRGREIEDQKIFQKKQMKAQLELELKTRDPASSITEPLFQQFVNPSAPSGNSGRAGDPQL